MSRIGVVAISSCLVLAVCGLSILDLSAQSGASSPLSVGFLATPLGVPSGYPVDTPSFEHAVACPPSGSCVAVGDFEPSSDEFVPTATGSGSGDGLGQSVIVSAPANSDLVAVSCAASGSCTAVGSGSTGPIAATSTGGVFSAAVALAPPTNAGPASSAVLTGVACTGPGDCIAVGSYSSDSKVFAMIAVQSGGVFARAVEVTAPSGGTNPSFNAISCGSMTTCLAVGSYESSGGEVPMVIEVVNNIPSSAAAAPLASGASGGRLNAVSCTVSTTCEAVGFDDTASGPVPMTMSTTTGTFTSANLLTPSPHLVTLPSEAEDEITGLGCISAGNCLLVGDANSHYLGFQGAAYTEANDTVSSPYAITGTGYATFTMGSVACGASGACFAVGSETPGVATGSEAVEVSEVQRATPSLTSIASGQASYNYEAGFTDTATLSAGSVTPDGQLVFLAFGPNDPTCSFTPDAGIEPVDVSGDGDYTSDTALPAGGAGDYHWVVIYTGDENNNPVVSECGSANETSVLHMAMGGSLPTAEYESNYLGFVWATGGTQPVTYRVTSGSLPDGLTFGSDGRVTGEPNNLAQTGETFTFAVSAVDALGATGSGVYSIVVSSHGYWLVGSDGGIFTFGNALFYGSTGDLDLQRPVVGIVPAADRNGYWLDASDGGVFAFGSAGFYGSIPGLGLHPAGSGLPHSLNAPIVGMVPSAHGGGYFMVAADGGVFAFGDARFAGSCPGIGGCSGAAVAVMPDASGNGYWVVTQTGHVYAFGDALYYGAPGPQSVPVTSAVRTPDGRGYWILFANGAIANYGDAGAFGSPVGRFGGFNPTTAMFATWDGGGYWVASANGSVDNYGDAPTDGGMSGTKLNGPIIAATGW